MNIGQIIDVSKAYLQQEDDCCFNAGGVDLGLVAANNAKKRAERLHDWNAERTTVELDLVGTANLSDAVGYGSEVKVPIKSPYQFYIETTRGTDTVLTPVRHNDVKRAARRDVEYRDKPYNIYTWQRYPGDAYTENFRSEVKILMQGNQISLTPPTNEATKIVIDAYQWLPEYTGPNDEDWFTENGQTYLQWAIIAELNHLTQTFVDRQEGSIGSRAVEQARDGDLQDLIMQDDYQNEVGREVEKLG